MINALAILLLCQLAGETVVRLLDLPVPGPVLGMALLFGVLAVRGAAPAPLSTLANNLLAHLSLLFVPAGVGVMLHLGRLEHEWLAIGAALVASTLCTIVVSVAVFRLVSRWAGAEEPPA